MITIEQFRFEFAGYGHYWATYTTPNRGDYWRHIINCMPLIDATKNAENPTQRDMKLLRHHIMTNGTHYNKKGEKI